MNTAITYCTKYDYRTGYIWTILDMVSLMNLHETVAAQQENDCLIQCTPKTCLGILHIVYATCEKYHLVMVIQYTFLVCLINLSID